jgi:large subunit ribosomal protein L20
MNALTFINIYFNLLLYQHKNLLKYAKGYRGRSKNCFRIAIRRIEKAWQYSYRDRKRKHREWRKLWIMRLQAAVRLYGFRYSQVIPALQKADIQLNRKVLAEVAANEPFAFYAIVRTLEATNAGLQKGTASTTENSYSSSPDRMAA